jgi:hypothetical protein
MIQMDQSIQAHLSSGLIDVDEAYIRAHGKALFRPRLGRVPGVTA